MIEIQGNHGIIKIHDADSTNIKENRRKFFDTLKEALKEINKNKIIDDTNTNN
jgi:dTDP-4-amino-4,6-dideoxygalactose transaminase